MRNRLDDLAGKRLWSDPELNGLIDAALIEAVTRSHIIADTLTVPLTIGRSKYLLTDVLVIEAVRIGRKNLAQWAEFDLDRERPAWRSHVNGEPDIFIPVENSLTVWPPPDQAYEAKVDVRRLPALLETDDDEPEIPARFHIPMLDWAFHLAYDKRDADGSDPRRAELYAARFTESFGPRLTATQQRARSDGRKHISRPFW